MSRKSYCIFQRCLTPQLLMLWELRSTLGKTCRAASLLVVLPVARAAELPHRDVSLLQVEQLAGLKAEAACCVGARAFQWERVNGLGSCQSEDVRGLQCCEEGAGVMV